VLIAGLNDEHRTEVTLDGVHIQGITPAQVHGRFATVTLGASGTNINFSKTEITVVPAKSSSEAGSSAAKTPEPAFSCDEKFVPMS
jgi:polygalacturonase